MTRYTGKNGDLHLGYRLIDLQTGCGRGGLLHVEGFWPPIAFYVPNCPPSYRMSSCNYPFYDAVQRI